MNPPEDAPAADEVTLTLRDVTLGTADRRAELFDQLHAALRTLAARHLAAERPDHTLQPTALVNECWLKFIDQQVVPDGGKRHFLAVASQSMRRILVDYARARGRDKRGGDRQRVDLDRDITLHDAVDRLDLVALEEAMAALERQSERQARVIELRFFGGLTPPEAAEVLAVSLSTVEREWRIARAWLLHRLKSA